MIISAERVMYQIRRMSITVLSSLNMRLARCRYWAYTYTPENAPLDRPNCRSGTFHFVKGDVSEKSRSTRQDEGPAEGKGEKKLRRESSQRVKPYPKKRRKVR